MKIIEKAISRLQTYEDALMGRLSLEDSDDTKVVQFANMYKNMAKKSACIIASLRNELISNVVLRSSRITGEQILLWLNTALKYNFEFGSSAKRLYLLPFNGQILLYFDFEAYREIVEKHFKILISVEPYSNTEIENFYECTNPTLDKRLWTIPDELPEGCQVPFKAPNEIFGFRIKKKRSSDHELIEVKKYKADKAILSDGYINLTKNKPFWKKFPYEMARKRAVMFHIKDEFVLKGNDIFSEMMNFELSQEKNAGLIN